MGFGLGTQELANEFMRLQDTDPELQKKLKGLTFNAILVTTNAPGDEDRQLEITLQGGRFGSVVARSEPAPSELRDNSFDKTKFDAKIISEHQTLCNMISGRLDVIETIKQVIIVGDFGKFMAQLAGFTGFIFYLGTMDIEP